MSFSTPKLPKLPTPISSTPKLPTPTSSTPTNTLVLPSSALKSDFVGCFNDSTTKLYKDYLGDQTPTKCNEQALAKGYKFFSLQAPQGLTGGKAKCYGGNTVPGTAPYTQATCPASGLSDAFGNSLGDTNMGAIYKVSQYASLPTDILLNASTYDDWSFGSVEGGNMVLQNPSPNEMNVSVLYTKNMKGSGDILNNVNHGDMLNGGNVKTYSVSGNSTVNVACNNNNIGPDPFPGYQKVCYKKINSQAVIGRYLKIQAGLKKGCMHWSNIYVYGKENNKNLATNAKVYMSSGYPSGSKPNINPDSQPGSNLVDDKLNTISHTNCSDTNPSWMMVDLGNDVPIHKVILASRQDCCSERGIGSTVSIYSSDGEQLYQSGGFPSTDNVTTAPVSDPGSASAKAYKFYIMTPPLKGVVGTNNMDFKGDYIMEHFDGQNSQDNTIVYIIITLLVLFFLYTFVVSRS